MNRKRNNVSLYLFLSLLALLLAACGGFSSKKVGWISSDLPLNELNARYLTFSGVESKKESLATGEALHLDYDVAVEKGSLTKIRQESPPALGVG